jgi:hypothetical protein
LRLQARGTPERWRTGPLPNSFAAKPEKLRETAVKLKEHAASFMANASEPEKRVSRLKEENERTRKR